MKKRRTTHHHRVHHRIHTRVHGKPQESYLVVVRSWMLIVLFAIMLGVGAIVGTAFSAQLNGPQVAGAATQAK